MLPPFDVRFRPRPDGEGHDVQLEDARDVTHLLDDVVPAVQLGEAADESDQVLGAVEQAVQLVAQRAGHGSPSGVARQFTHSSKW
jgi:hypothetical protein